MPCCRSNQKSGASESAVAASKETAKVAQENEPAKVSKECCEKPEHSKQCGGGC
jgi:hypothetical protein